MRYGCVYVQISIYHMFKNRKPLACYFAFPCPFHAFPYPGKPAHCQNRRTLFKYFVWCFCFTWKSQNCKYQYPDEKKTTKDFLSCFIQPFPKENKRDKQNGKNAWSSLWGLLNDSKRGQKCQVLYIVVTADPQKIFKVMFETVGTD